MDLHGPTHMHAYSPYVHTHHIDQPPCIYIYIHGGWSKCVHLQTAILRGKKKRSQISREPTIFLRGVMVVHFFAAEMSAQTECKRQLQTVKGRCKAMLWYNSTRKPQSFIVSRFPWRHEGVVWAMGFHGHLLFRHCFRRNSQNFREKSFANQPQNPHPESCLGVLHHLINSTWLYYIIFRQFNSEGSHFAPEKQDNNIYIYIIEI